VDYWATRLSGMCGIPPGITSLIPKSKADSIPSRMAGYRGKAGRRDKTALCDWSLFLLHQAVAMHSV